MTLLAPGTMLLAALLAVPPLVVFYLLKLRRKPMRVTSTMLWDQAQKDLEVNVPFRWIRPSWLLILHALILLALLIAIGRPAIEDPGAGASRVYLLIDRSASMNAPAGDGTRLDAAKAISRRRVEAMASGASPPEITVVAFAAEAVVVGPPTRDAATARGMIDSITPTDQAGDPRAALELVRALTTGGDRDADEQADTPAPLALLITDGADLGERTPALAGDARVRTVIAGDPEPPARNVGLTAFAADRELDAPASVRVFVRLINTAAAEAAVPVVVRLGDEPIARKAVTIPAGSPARPGETAESFRLEIPEGGVLSVTLERDDDLDADNAVFGVLPPVRRPAVLLVVPDATDDGTPAGARDRADPLLLDVIDAIGTAGLRVIDRRRYAANEETIAGSFGLVILDRVRPPRMPGVPTLSFGAPLPDHPAARIDASESGRTGVLAWDRDHPVMRDVVLDPVVIADRLRFPEDDEPIGSGSPEGTTDAPTGESDATRTTLARGADGPLIVALDDGGVRRIAVSFALDQSNWPVDFSFPIFVLSAFDWLVPGADAAVHHATNDTLTIPTPRGTERVDLAGPSARVIDLGGADAAGDAGAVPLGRPERAGLYEASFAGTGPARDAPPLPIAVNLLDPSESSLRVRAIDPDDDGDAGTIGGAGEGQREVWRWFVLAAAVGLLLEYLVYTLRARA